MFPHLLRLELLHQKPTPEPTLDPNIQYNINISSAIENGSIVVNNGTISSDEIKSVKWLADDNIPADAVAEDTNIFGNGKAVLNINGKDDSNGTITFWVRYSGTMSMLTEFKLK